MAILMGSQMVLGSFSGGINATNQQKSIKGQVCDVAKAMNSLVDNTKWDVTVIDEEILTTRAKSQDLAFQIIDIQRQIKNSQDKFKKTYNIWVTVGIIFIVLVAFLLLFKKVILKATTSPQKK